MAKEGIHLVVEHRAPWDRERAERLFAACGPERFEGRGAWVTPDDRARWASAAESSGWNQAYAWQVPGLDTLVRVSFSFRAHAFPFRGVDHAKWLHLLVELPFDTPEQLAWLADYLGRLDSAIGLGFGFADTAHHLRENAAADPRELVWPLMLVAPEDAAGLSGVTATPAGSRALVQVSPSPFSARARALEALARTLGMQARR